MPGERAHSGLGGEIPYLPEAAAKKKANFEKRLTDDPEIKCYLPGGCKLDRCRE
jgi:hypothetical protein